MQINNKLLNYLIQRLWILQFVYFVLLLAISFIFQDYELEFQDHDTYYVINFLHIGFFISAIHLVIGLCYYIFNNKIGIPKLVQVMHSVGSIVISAFLVLCILLFNKEMTLEILIYDRDDKNYMNMALLVASFISLQIVTFIVSTIYYYNQYMKKKAELAKEQIIDA